jgi:HlyD family secretion protein
MPPAPLPSALRRHAVLATIAGIALLLLAVVAGVRWIGGPRVAAIHLAPRDFVVTVVASGHVEAPHRVTIGSVVVGTVRRVPVDEGQVVREGQALVELDDTEWRASATQADGAVAQAAARLQQVGELESPVAEQAVRQAEVTLANAKRQQSRQASLLAQGFVGPAAMDDADKAVDLAAAQLATARAQERAAHPAGTDLVIARTGLAQARSAASAARAHLAYATIAAPVAGTLIARNVEVGDVVQPGTALMVLSPAGRVQLVVDIDERHLNLLQLGQPARASADAYADRLFDARLAYINPGVDATRGSVEVKLDVDHPPAWLAQDMTVSVDIQVATHPQALVLPLDAVHDVDTPHPWVLRAQDGHARRVDVVLGLRGAGHVEIVRGVASGDLVLAATAGVDADDRVRVDVASGG